MTNLKWWQTAVFYQVYPRSFADENGDGIGDLKGIRSHLDYLTELGIDAIWLSPHYPSPQFDCGYDIADYTDVEPAYGTLEEFQRFLREAHQRGLKVILDLVLNHTSDQHPWFLESRSSRDNPKRDWYIWRDGKDGGPPNNWAAAFDECAWTYDPQTDQWYYHFFFAQQPDLNWRNPEVKQAMFDVVRFWLDMGVDGFRLDAIGTLFEDPHLPDHQAEIGMIDIFKERIASYPDRPDKKKDSFLATQRELMNAYQTDQPGIHALLQELRALVDQYEDRVLVGETDEIEYYGDGTNELHLIFNFPLMRTEKLTPAWIRANQEERLNALPPQAWPCNTLGNHDSPRVFSRYGNTVEMARLSLALMLTLKGTPFLYYGEEIGMTDLTIPTIEQFRDNLGIWVYHTLIEQLNYRPDEALSLAQTVTRDKCRTPMQWANAPNAGFSLPGVETWLPVNPNYAQGVNVTEQACDPGSLLNFYKKMLRVRKSTPALVAGEYQAQHQEAEDYLAFTRATASQTCLVVLNYSGKSHNLAFDLEKPTGKVLFSSQSQPAVVDLQHIHLAPYEILIVET